MPNASRQPLPLSRASRREAHARSTYGRFLRAVQATTFLPREEAEIASVCVLEELERRLFGSGPVKLEAQLPKRLRALLQRSPRRRLPPEKFHAPELLARLAVRLGTDEATAEHIARGVLSVVRWEVSEGEIRHLKAQLPSDLARLFDFDEPYGDDADFLAVARDALDRASRWRIP